MTIIPSIVSVVLSLFLWLYIHRSVKRNLIDLFQINPLWIWGINFLFFYCGFFRFIYRIQNTSINNSIFYFFLNLSYILMGFLGLVIVFLILMDIKNIIEKYGHRLFHKNSMPPEFDLSRREFFKKNLALTGLAASSLVSGAGFANSFDPKIVKVNIPLPPLHKNLTGLKIVQLSDIHIGPTLKKDFCEMLAKKIETLNADIVVITGDMVDGEVEYLKDELSPFLNLKSKLGTYYITGNHEYYWQADAWIAWAKTSGLNPLVNQNVKLNFNGADFYLAGVNDPASIKLDKKNATDPHKAAAGIPPNAYKILLAHRPETCFVACKAGFHTQLSGHTHGGQGFPWNIIVHLVQPYVRGLNYHDGMNVYVHSGTGFWGPPNRFMINSEIAEIVFE